jgi:hypothetical protein
MLLSKLRLLTFAAWRFFAALRENPTLVSRKVR